MAEVMLHERMRKMLGAALVFSLAMSIAFPGASFADGSTGTQLGLRITDSSQSQGSGEEGEPGSTQLGIRVTDSSNPAPLTVTVTFDANGGSAVSDQIVAYNTAVAEPAYPVWEGHAFAGWFTEPSGGSAYDFDAAVLGNLILYAHWTVNVYTVSFETDGGTLVDSQTVDHGGLAARPADPSKAGYEFEGWFSDVGCTQPYDFNAAVASDKVLYAKWAASYTIAFDKNGGEGDMAPMDMVVGQKKALAANSFTRTGYTFKEWNTKPDGSGAPYADGAEVDFASATAGSEVKLYAQWALQVVCDVPTAAAVTVDASGAVTGEDQEFVSGSAAPLEVGAVKSARLAGAESVFADATTLSGVRVTLTPPASAGSPVQVPLATSANGQPAGFAIPAKGKLSVSFGLSIPANAKLSFVGSAADVAQLTYVIGPAS